MGKFQIEDIDGCEFVKCKTAGNMMISFDQDMVGFYRFSQEDSFLKEREGSQPSE
ncbi:hypothetical protein [Bacillus paramycoides]|uniref:hypothetical protein n=1 Tax=Bacillus paramycoides TaxID=2026194 RepID=UPI002E1E2746|nr:hypothetical protein [Bacillus paramycoides]